MAEIASKTNIRCREFKQTDLWKTSTFQKILKSETYQGCYKLTFQECFKHLVWLAWVKARLAQHRDNNQFMKGTSSYGELKRIFNLDQGFGGIQLPSFIRKKQFK